MDGLIDMKKRSTYFTKASMISLHTSTLIVSFWNMSKKGRNLSYKNKLKLSTLYALYFSPYQFFLGGRGVGGGIT